MRTKSVLSALGIACALIVGLDYVTFAATGQSAILGKVNKAGTVTTLQRTTNGPAASFVTKVNQPPFAVTRATKVTRLNADQLDGKDSTAFAANVPTKVYKFTTTVAATSHVFTLPVPPPGKYLVTYSVATDLSNGSEARTLSCEIGQFEGFIFGTYQASGRTAASTPAGGPFLGLSGTSVIDPTGFSNLSVQCSGSANWSTPPTVSTLGTTLAQPATVTITKLANSTTTSTTSARLSPQQIARLERRTNGG